MFVIAAFLLEQILEILDLLIVVHILARTYAIVNLFLKIDNAFFLCYSFITVPNFGRGRRLAFATCTALQTLENKERGTEKREKMKRSKKLVSFLLALTLLVTAVPANGTNRVPEAKAAQTDVTENSDNRLIKWAPVEGDDSVTVSNDRVKKAAVIEYGEDSGFYYRGFLFAVREYEDAIEVNEEKLQELTGDTGYYVSVTPDDVSCQWYEVDASGKRTKLEGYTGSSLQLTYPSYAEADDLVVTNEKKERTFVCDLTVDKITIDGTDYALPEDSELLADGERSLEYKFTLKYTGDVIAKSQVDEYFDGLDDVKDKTITAHHKDDCYNYVEDLLSVSEIRRQDYNASYFNYKWTVYYKDGTKEVVSEKKHSSYIASEYGSQINGSGKQVDHYACEIDLCYGYQVIDTITKNFHYRYAPFDFHGDAEVTQTIRNNATVEMDVDAWIADTEAVVPDSLSYQWYRMDAEGNETKLAKETASTYTVRVPDPSVVYKVEVKAQKQKDFQGPEFEPVLTRTFRFTSSEGYLLKDISYSWYSINIGDTQKLYVEPRVDDSYTLDYEWEKVCYERDDEGNVVYDGSGKRKIISEQVSTTKECEVKPADVSDFEAITGYDGENGQDTYNYRVTVSVKKGKEVIDSHVYTFRIAESISYEVIEESASSQVLNPGDDLELYVKTSVKDCYTLEKNWYKKVGEGVAATRANVESGGIEYISADPVFVIPDKFDRVEQGTYEKWDEELGPCYRYTFWEKIGSGDSVRISGMEAGKAVDVRGNYRCYLEMYRAGEEKDEEKNPVSGSSWHNFNVTYDSDLSAYAKSCFPVVKEGNTAKLRVVAQTRSDVYKLHYKWEKQGTDGQYTEIKNNDRPDHVIDKAAASDAGQYRVTVSDEYGGSCAPISIWLSVQEEEKTEVSSDVTHICYTPAHSVYELGVGQKVNLRLDMKLSDADTEVYYAWYRDEKLHRGGLYTSEESNWELIGEDKNTYELEAKSEDDFTAYKCMAVYRKNNTEYAKVEVTFTVRQAYTAELEKMTVANQIKRRGDSASYQVRLVTDDPALTVNYQWYRDDGTEIEGAAKETYAVTQLKQGDFGRIYCVATDAQTGKRVAEPAYFTTSVYRNGAYLEKSNVEVEAAVGDAVTTLGPPVIARGDGLELTYQWYRYRTDADNDHTGSTIIYGAKEPSYKIEEIGDNEFTQYRCEIYAEGDYLASYYTTVTEKQEDKEEEEEDPIVVKIPEKYETTVKAFLGSGAKFAVAAESKKGLELRYQWYYRSSNGGSGQAIGGATKNEYEIAVVTSAKKGYYYCVVMDEQGNRAQSESFTLLTTTGLSVDTEGFYTSDAVGVQTSFGAQNLVLTATATASTEHGYQPFYQWYHETIDERGLIYGATSQELTLPLINEEALGMYYCVVKDSSGADYTLKYYVYVNNGLNAAPSTYHVLQQADGSAKMYVTATANAGCVISYQWSKFGKDEDGESRYLDIEGAVQDTLVRGPFTSEDYGNYRCKISTPGERKYYYFSIQPDYAASINREFAGQGDSVSVTAQLENPAVNRGYSYQWYEQEPVTGTYRRVKDGTGAVLTKVAPAVDLSEQFTGESKLGYVPVGYKCVIKIQEGEKSWEEIVEAKVNVLPDLAYQGTAFPETNHPNDKAFDLKTYRAEGAEQLKLTFDGMTDLGATACLYVIDRQGSYRFFDGTNKSLAGQTITISGDSVVFLMNGNQKADSYGYKVSNVEPVYKPQPSENQPNSSKATPGSDTSGLKYGAAAAKKKTVFTIKNLKYKITSATKKSKTVTVTGGKSKKLKSVTIPATVKIAGVKYKVTAVSAKAFQGYSKLKSVTIGKNVKKIGASAFAKDKSLTKVTVKGTAIKSVGKKAFANVPKKAAVKVPAKSRKSYKKLFKKGALKAKVK